MNEMVQITKQMLNDRGVKIEDIAHIVLKLQENIIQTFHLVSVLKMLKKC